MFYKNSHGNVCSKSLFLKSRNQSYLSQIIYLLKIYCQYLNLRSRFKSVCLFMLFLFTLQLCVSIFIYLFFFGGVASQAMFNRPTSLSITLIRDLKSETEDVILWVFCILTISSVIVLKLHLVVLYREILKEFWHYGLN